MQKERVEYFLNPGPLGQRHILIQPLPISYCIDDDRISRLNWSISYTVHPKLHISTSGLTWDEAEQNMRGLIAREFENLGVKRMLGELHPLEQVGYDALRSVVHLRI